MHGVDFLNWFARVKKADTTGTNFPATTAYVLGDVIDLKKSGFDISMGHGESMWLVIRTGLAFATAGAGLYLELVSSDTNPGAAAWTSPTIHLTTATFTYATAPALGLDWLAVQLPRGAYKRYLGLRANFTTIPTTGRVNAFLATAVRNGQIIPQGIIGS